MAGRTREVKAPRAVLLAVLAQAWAGAGAGECGCKTPGRGDALAAAAGACAAEPPAPALARDGASAARHAPAALARIPGGHFTMGTDTPGVASDGESPAVRVCVSPFAIGVAEVSNREWAAFVAASGHVSDAERFGWSFVFEGHATREANERAVSAVAGAPWWLRVDGASWRHPFGPGSDALSAGLLEHPVVHVSWADAQAYCAHSYGPGGRLPTEAEWERAAGRGAAPPAEQDAQAEFPWGRELRPDRGRHRCNVWQGAFPRTDRGLDGFNGSAPVRSMGAQNGYGLHHLIGNVWEWVEDAYATAPRAPAGGGVLRNPRGPRVEARAGEAAAPPIERTKKGGSFLCHKSYCFRYRIPARTGSSADSSTSNLGFRCAQELALGEGETDPCAQDEQPA